VLDPKVFKAYDVRGIYPAEIDEDGARAIGRAYVEQFEPERIAVGRDMRTSSPSMAQAAIEGAVSAGAEVVDIGLVGTEMLYLAVGHLSLDGGIQVTASHNPKKGTPGRKGRGAAGRRRLGLLDIRDRALSLDHTRDRVPGQVGRRCLSGLVDRCCPSSTSRRQPQRVVIDAANGMAGVMPRPSSSGSRSTPSPTSSEPDGSFPNHQPNPLLPRTANS
jgi:phosphomannomutase